MQTEERPAAGAYYVPACLQRVGCQVVPVPVYYPDVTTILGHPVQRRLSEIRGEIDLVVVFRRPRILPHRYRRSLPKRPKAVWLQLGIWNHEVVEELARADIDVVQDRCTMHRMP